MRAIAKGILESLGQHHAAVAKLHFAHAGTRQAEDEKTFHNELGKAHTTCAGCCLDALKALDALPAVTQETRRGSSELRSAVDREEFLKAVLGSVEPLPAGLSLFPQVDPPGTSSSRTSTPDATEQLDKLLEGR